MPSPISRQLEIWADFNAIDGRGRYTGSLRFSASPELPMIGELVLLADDEGNSVTGIVEEVAGLVVHARPDMSTWSSAEIAIRGPIGEPSFNASLVVEEEA